MKGAKLTMLTETAKDLVGTMKYLNMGTDFILDTLDRLPTEREQEVMLNSIVLRYRKKGEVTEEDINKIIVMMYGTKKTQSMSREKTDGSDEKIKS